MVLDKEGPLFNGNQDIVQKYTYFHESIIYTPLPHVLL